MWLFSHMCVRLEGLASPVSVPEMDLNGKTWKQKPETRLPSPPLAPTNSSLRTSYFLGRSEERVMQFSQITQVFWCKTAWHSQKKIFCIYTVRIQYLLRNHWALLCTPLLDMLTVKNFRCSSQDFVQRTFNIVAWKTYTVVYSTTMLQLLSSWHGTVHV